MAFKKKNQKSSAMKLSDNVGREQWIQKGKKDEKMPNNLIKTRIMIVKWPIKFGVQESKIMNLLTKP